MDMNEALCTAGFVESPVGGMGTSCGAAHHPQTKTTTPSVLFVQVTLAL